MAKQTIGQRKKLHAGNIHMRDQKHRKYLGACYYPNYMDDFGIADSIAPMRGFVIGFVGSVIIVSVAYLVFFYDNKRTNRI